MAPPRPLAQAVLALTLLLAAAAPLTAQSPARAASAPPAASASSLATHPDVLAAQRLFSAWLEGQLAYRGLPGVVVAVVADQELVWAQGFGWADVERRVPMTPATKFRIASHSKLFAATAIMQLREEGKVRLDDPVDRYLPWFRVRPAGDDDGPITIEQLLSHSSGLPREASDHWSTLDFPTEAQIRELVGSREAAFAPQTRWKYSNLAYAVAGLVLEEVTGERWEDYVEREIFRLLGMHDTSVDRDVDGLAVGYGRRMPDGTREVMPFTDARGMAAATGMTSTVEDMARFVSAQFRRGPRGGPRILTTGSLREMHRVRSVENNWNSGNGLGFSTTRADGRSYVGHSGLYPGYTTITQFQPESRVGVIVFTNTNDSDPGVIARQLMRTVGEAVERAAAAPPPTVAWDPAWARFAGLYRGPVGDQHVVLMNERLVVISPHATTIDIRVELEPLGDGRFRFAAPTGGGPIGEIVRFVEEGGTVVRMITGDTWIARVH
jgi:D-alanyl-D-alanine carboxypeptidase